MNNKLLAILAVIVVVAAGAAAAVVMLNNNPGKNDSGSDFILSSDINPTLEVYGNVNGDTKIDREDAELLKRALADGTAEKYAYADANFDGVIDNRDVEYIEKIINATPENPVEVKHLNRYTKGDYYTVSTIPTDSVAISGSANIILMLKYLNVLDEIKALAYNKSIDAAMYDEYQKLFSDLNNDKFDPAKSYTYRVGASAGYFSGELLSNHINKDKITTIVTADNASTYLSGKSNSHSYGITEEDAKNLKLGVVRVASASTDPTTYLSDLALLAFVFHKDVSVVQDMTDWYAKAIKDLNGKLESKIGKNNAVRFAVSSATSYSVSSDGKVTTYNYISSGNSDYTAVVGAAGGIWAMDSYDFGTSSSSAKYTDEGLWLADYKIDKLVVIKTGDPFSWYGGTALDKGLDTLKSCCNAFKKTEAYYNNNVYVLSGDMPIILRTVYSACILYPGVFDGSWADGYNAEYCEKFLGYDRSTVADGCYYVSMNDLGLKGH